MLVGVGEEEKNIHTAVLVIEVIWMALLLVFHLVFTVGVLAI